MQICFYFEKKKSDLHLIKMQIYYGFEKNSDLHLIKVQICFGFKKIIVHMQIIGIQERD